MNNQYIQNEKPWLFDFEENDERLSVEYVNPSPLMDATSIICFDSYSFDENGLVINYSNGDFIDPCTFEMKLVFPSPCESMRTFVFKECHENKLDYIIEKGETPPYAVFHMYRCKHTNYYNWCMKQGPFHESEGYAHYIMVAFDRWIDVFCKGKPKSICKYYGLQQSMTEEDL